MVLMRIFSRGPYPHLLLAVAACLSLSTFAAMPHDRVHPLLLMLGILPLQLGALLWVRLTQQSQVLRLPASDRSPAPSHNAADYRH